MRASKLVDGAGKVRSTSNLPQSVAQDQCRIHVVVAKKYARDIGGAIWVDFLTDDVIPRRQLDVKISCRRPAHRQSRRFRQACDEFLDNAETKAGTTFLSRVRCVGLCEFLEDVGSEI